MNGDPTGGPSNARFEVREQLTRFLLNDGAEDRALLVVNRDGLVEEAHGASATIIGGTTADLRGMALATLFPSTASTSSGKSRLLDQILGGKHVRRRGWCVRRNRSRFWAEIIAAPIPGKNGEICGGIVAIRDLTELRRAEGDAVRAPRTSSGAPKEDTATAFLDAITNALFVVDEEWRFVYVNARCTQVLRKPREELIGAALWQELPVTEGSAFRRHLMKAASERMAVQFEEYYPLLNAWFEVHVYPHAHGLVIYFWDISDRKLAINRVRQQSLYDPLTGVANTLLFEDRTATAIARAQRTEATLAVLVVNLDGFTAINALHGHGTGDQLLQTIAARMKSILRRSDTIARLGGGEFGIMSSDHREVDGPALLAEKLIRATSRPFELGEVRVEMTASVGIALFPQDGGDDEALVLSAHDALASARRAGGNTYRFFSPTQSVEIQGRRAVENGLSAALDDNALELWFQPERSLHDATLTAMEALLQWTDTTNVRKLLKDCAPPNFSVDLIVRMEDWVLNEACRYRAAWALRLESTAPVTVNVSASTLLFGDLVARVRTTLGDSGLAPALLELEFSQPDLMKAGALTNKTLTELRDLGVRLSLDGVGAREWATLALLDPDPFGKVKLDPALLSSHTNDTDRESAIRAASSFARAVGRKVVIAGVSNAQQVELMKRCDCDAMQGEFAGHPIRFADADALLFTHTSQNVAIVANVT